MLACQGTGRTEEPLTVRWKHFADRPQTQIRAWAKKSDTNLKYGTVSSAQGKAGSQIMGHTRADFSLNGPFQLWLLNN